MSTDPGVWGWTEDIGRLGFTVTFSLGLDPEDVLGQYGADLGRAEQLTREQAWSRFPPESSGAQLRAGRLGRWGFCFEEAGVEGIQTPTLRGLSAETETIAFCTAQGASSFVYLKDAEGVEAFELGRPETVRGSEPFKFWSDVQRIVDRSGQAGSLALAHAALQAITKHVRAPLDRAALEGPLLTASRSQVEAAQPPPEPPMSPEPPVSLDTAPMTLGARYNSYLGNAARAS